MSVLESAKFISENSENVFVSTQGCKDAGEVIYNSMTNNPYSTETWTSHVLNPKDKSSSTVDWIFTIDTLNFSFWSDYDDNDTGKPSSQRFTVEYNGTQYTGYWSLCAAINKALDKGIPITSPTYWASENFTKDVLKDVFKSETKEQIPLFEERYQVLKEAGDVIVNKFKVKSFSEVIPLADESAVKLVNLVAQSFKSYDDTSVYKKKKGRKFWLCKENTHLLKANLDLYSLHLQEGTDSGI